MHNPAGVNSVVYHVLLSVLVLITVRSSFSADHFLASEGCKCFQLSVPYFSSLKLVIYSLEHQFDTCYSYSGLLMHWNS